MEPSLDFVFLEHATETLRALAHPQRMQIVELLSNTEQLNVTEIYTHMQIEQAVASHHLRILKDKAIVAVRRDGKNSFYTLSNRCYFDIILMLRKLHH
jgi:DNA-binding transcriptional ArsR family regulator